MGTGEQIMAKPIREGLFLLEPLPRLMGCLCGKCGNYYYPVRHICPKCGWEQLENCLLSSCGTIKAFTVIHSKPPEGFVVPYAVGYVELAGNNLVVPTMISAEALSEIHEGDQVNLIVEPISSTPEGRQKLIYKFEVEKGA